MNFLQTKRKNAATFLHTRLGRVKRENDDDFSKRCTTVKELDSEDV